MRAMAVRLVDVARLAGVSVKTVSNVVNNAPHIRESTREKVEAAIAELGYRPNLAARQLKSGRAGFLALVVPDLRSPYFAELATVFSDAAFKRGYVILHETTHAQAENERLVLSGVPASVDGVVFSPLALTSEEIGGRTDPRPMVLLGERVAPPDTPRVTVDSIAAARAMTEHLISLGRTRIAAIGRESATGTASVRLSGYRQALAAAGLPNLHEYEIGVDEYSRSAGREAMHKLLALTEPPDAVFCFNDLMAIGALRACSEAGIGVPDDVAVAGFDDIVEGRYSNPTLTTVTPDIEGLVDRVLDRLIEQIERRVTGSQGEEYVDWRLSIRESTAGSDAAEA